MSPKYTITSLNCITTSLSLVKSSDCKIVGFGWTRKVRKVSGMLGGGGMEEG